MKKALIIILSLSLFSPLIACAQVNLLNEVKAVQQDFALRFKEKEDRENLSKLRDYIDEKDADLKRSNELISALNQKLNGNIKGIPDTLLNQLQAFERTENVKKYIDSPMFQVPPKMLTGSMSQLKYFAPYGTILRSAIDSYRAILEDMKTYTARKKVLEDNLVCLKSDMDKATNEVQKIYTVTDNINQTKLWISLTFASIIIILLLLFFAFLISKSKVGSAKDFFQGNGLQFVALFALIISIILFGVLGILEGKELAAILSGISGFILGKASGKSESEEEISKANKKAISEEASNAGKWKEVKAEAEPE